MVLLKSSAQSSSAFGTSQADGICRASDARAPMRHSRLVSRRLCNLEAGWRVLGMVRPVAARKDHGDVDGWAHGRCRDRARLVYLGGYGPDNWELIVDMTTLGQQTVRFTGDERGHRGTAGDGLGGVAVQPRAPIAAAAEASARCPAHCARTRLVHSSSSAELPSSSIRSARDMCTQAFTGCPARSGSSPAVTSRRMPWSENCIVMRSHPHRADVCSPSRLPVLCRGGGPPSPVRAASSDGCIIA